jgi:AcrR family transcriptional regulator
MRKQRDTRTVILSTARELFMSQGYAATSMRQVARRTGIAKATIYHYFKDKRDLMEQLVAEAIIAMRRTFDALAGEADPVGRLSLAAESALGFLSRYSDIIQVARREVPGVRGRLSADAGGLLEGYEKLIREAIATGTRQGVFRVVDPTDAAYIFMTMLQGSFAHAMFSGAKPKSGSRAAPGRAAFADVPGRAAPGRAAAALLEVFLHGISAADAGKGKKP